MIFDSLSGPNVLKKPANLEGYIDVAHLARLTDAQKREINRIQKQFSMTVTPF